MGITDNVAAYIIELLREDNTAEIQRNELANVLGCVPSQINYVIASRFTPEQGYVVESRRGGGGYIRITRRVFSSDNTIMHFVNSIGNSIDSNTARIILENFAENKIISNSNFYLISAAISDIALQAAPRELRSMLRASILKNTLIACK